MGLLLYPGNRCEDGEATLVCEPITSSTYLITITNANYAYYINTASPETRIDIPLTDGAAEYFVTLSAGEPHMACAGRCGKCKICCTFSCSSFNLCDCCGPESSEIIPPIPEMSPEDVLLYDAAWYCSWIGVFGGWVCVNAFGGGVNGEYFYYISTDTCEEIPEPDPVPCECFSDFGIKTVQYIQFEVTGTGTGTFDPFIPPDDEFPACDEADCPDFNGTYIVPCEGTDGPYGGLYLLCTTDIGGTNYDWYTYKWWYMADGVLYLRMGLISRLSGSGDPAPTPVFGFSEADWEGDDVDVQDRLDDRYYEWDKTVVEFTDPCIGITVNTNSCDDLDVFATIVEDSGLCNDPTVTITELIYS